MSIFEQASRKKLRFKATNGQVNTEDLWGMSFEALKAIAVALKKELGNDDELDFIPSTTSKNTDEALKYEVVKHIILKKQDEAEARAQERRNAARAQVLLARLDNKENEKVDAMTEDQLKAELVTLGFKV